MTALGLSEGGDDRSPRPPVHYQISVTGRQAGVFFFALLVALSIAFFFGMKTGAAARKGTDVVASLATASDLPVPTLAPAESAGRKIERSPEKPPDESLGFAATRKAASRDAATAIPAAATPLPEPTSVPSPTKAPASAPPAAASPASGVKEAPAKAASKGPYYVQVLATKKAPAADELMKRLKGEGFAADVSAVPGKDGWFRVRVGPFKDRAKAESAAKKIKTTDKQIKNTPQVVQ